MHSIKPSGSSDGEPISPDTVATLVLDTPPVVRLNPSPPPKTETLRPSVWLVVITALAIVTVSLAASRAQSFEHPEREESWILEHAWRSLEASPTPEPPPPPKVPAAVKPLLFPLRWLTAQQHAISLAVPMRRMRTFFMQRVLPIGGFVGCAVRHPPSRRPRAHS